jgi:hypothetical protein
MDFYSVEFFMFFFLVAILFFATPFRFRWIILLAASYYFYGSFGIKYCFMCPFDMRMPPLIRIE